MQRLPQPGCQAGVRPGSTAGQPLGDGVGRETRSRAGTTTAPVSVTPVSQSSSITPPAGTVTNHVSTKRVSSSLRVISAPGACSRAVTSELPKVTVSALGSSVKRTGSAYRPTLIDSIGVRSLVSSIRTSVVTETAQLGGEHQRLGQHPRRDRTGQVQPERPVDAATGDGIGEVRETRLARTSEVGGQVRRRLATDLQRPAAEHPQVGVEQTVSRRATCELGHDRTVTTRQDLGRRGTHRDEIVQQRLGRLRHGAHPRTHRTYRTWDTWSSCLPCRTS